MKKIFLIVIIILFITGCNLNKNSDILLMESGVFNDISIKDVYLLEIIEYTIDGRNENLIENYDDILKKYNYLNSFKIGEETNKVCEDNTTIYNFKQKDKIISIKIECNVLVIDNKRYELIK